MSEESITAISPPSTLSPPPTPLAVTAFGITHPGKVRESNEDQFLIAELSKRMKVWQTSLPEPKLQVGEDRAHLLLVADGMGGHRAGERASAIAVAAIEQLTLNTFRWFFAPASPSAKKVLAQFQAALSQADAVLEAAEYRLKGMGTTRHDVSNRLSITIVHVGDSRAYLYRGGELHQPPGPTLVAELRAASAAAGNGQPIRHVTGVVAGRTPSSRSPFVRSTAG